MKEGRMEGLQEELQLLCAKNIHFLIIGPSHVQKYSFQDNRAIPLKNVLSSFPFHKQRATGTATIECVRVSFLLGLLTKKTRETQATGSRHKSFAPHTCVLAPPTFLYELGWQTTVWGKRVLGQRNTSYVNVPTKTANSPTAPASHSFPTRFALL